MAKWSDQIPEWAKQGVVDLKNYDLRVLWHGQTRGWGDNWPMLTLASPFFGLWHEYFGRHLGGFPWAFSALLSGRIKQMNVPESRPEHFDPSFSPTAGYRALLPRWSDAYEHDPGHREKMTQRFQQLLADLRGSRFSHDSGASGPAPVGYIFSNYDEAIRRNGKPRSGR